MKLKVRAFDEFSNLVKHCQTGLDRTKSIRDQETVEDDRVEEEIEEIEHTEIELEKAPIRNYPKPVIPPLWEVLNLPGPMHFGAPNPVVESTPVETAQNENYPEIEKIEEKTSEKEDLDEMSDEAFIKWRQNHPRSSEPMMAERYASDNPLSNHFINSFLDDSDSSSVSSKSSSEEASSDEEISTDDDFHASYAKLYTSWRSHWKNAAF